MTFGADDTTCASVTLAGDAEDAQPIRDGAECLIAEIEAGNPVTIDFSIGTIEGDQIYSRYAFDGEEILIVRDDRADEFGSNDIVARVCQSVEAELFGPPSGVDCLGLRHGGFTDAEG